MAITIDGVALIEAVGHGRIMAPLSWWKAHHRSVRREQQAWCPSTSFVVCRAKQHKEARVAPVSAGFDSSKCSKPQRRTRDVEMPSFYWSITVFGVPGCRVKELNTIDGVAPVKAGFDDAQVAAIISAFEAQPDDVLLLVGGRCGWGVTYHH